MTKVVISKQVNFVLTWRELYIYRSILTIYYVCYPVVMLDIDQVWQIDNQITKKKMKNLFYEYYTHTTSNYIKFLIGVNFYGDVHLDVSRC